MTKLTVSTNGSPLELNFYTKKSDYISSRILKVKHGFKIYINCGINNKITFPQDGYYLKNKEEAKCVNSQLRNWLKQGVDFIKLELSDLKKVVKYGR